MALRSWFMGSRICPWGWSDIVEVTTSECHEIAGQAVMTCVRRRRLARIPVTDNDLFPSWFKGVVAEKYFPKHASIHIQRRIRKHDYTVNP